MLQILTVTFPLLPLVLSFSHPFRGLQTCKAPCSTCEPQCTACIANAHMDSTSTCVCDEGFYLSNFYGDCEKCGQQACKTCVSSSSCVSCVKNAYLTSIGCKCEAGYYWADSQKCDICHETCLECSDKGEFSCTKCAADAILKSSHSCGCYTGYFLSSPEKTCFKCSFTCYSCKDASPQTCLSCASNMVMISKPPGPCKCKDKYFWEIDKCLNCHSSCATCLASGYCTTCDTTAKLTSEKQCICDSKSYMLYSECIICDTRCKTCSSGDSGGCLTCPDTFVLSGPSPNFCVCATGHYLPLNARSCVPCHSSCRTCKDNSATSCLSCKENSSLNSAPPSSCVCDAGYFLSELTCSDCPIACQNCTGTKSAQCSACSKRAVLNSLKECQCAIGTAWFSSSRECKCKDGYFYQVGKGCSSCLENCAKCSGPDVSNCLECLGETVLLQTGCGCPPGQPPPFKGTCPQCHPTCANCFGSGISQCQTCAPNRELKGGFCPCKSGYSLTKSQQCEKDKDENEFSNTKKIIIAVTLVGAWLLCGGVGLVLTIVKNWGNGQPLRRDGTGEELAIVPHGGQTADLEENSSYEIRNDGTIIQ